MNAGALAGAAAVLWILLWCRARATRRTIVHRLAPVASSTAPAPRSRPRPSRVAPSQRDGRPLSGARTVDVAPSPRDGRPPSGARSLFDTEPALESRRLPPVGDVALEEVCDRLARDLRGGHSLTAAVLDAADELRHPFLLSVAHGVRAGRPLVVAVDAAVPAGSDADVGLVAQVLAVAAEHGGAPAEAIDRAASTLRERAALRAERAAQAASARLSTRVMTVLPVGFTVLVAAGDPAVRAVLVGTPIGWTCLAVGLTLNLLGRAWARRAMATP